jgi:glycerol-3-phosphate acyltransferase PlsY
MQGSLGLAAAVLLSYAIGAIPVGVVVARSRGVDLLNRGSGKMGFTNVQRVLGTAIATPVLALDMAKGVLALLLARALVEEPTPVGETGCILVAMIGHSWSPIVWLVTGQLRGGRSVAIAFGGLVMVSPLAAVGGLITLAVVVLATRYVSLGTLLALPLGFVVLVVQMLQGNLAIGYLGFGSAIAVFLLIRHSGNIRRLAAGTERRLGQRA